MTNRPLSPYPRDAQRVCRFLTLAALLGAVACTPTQGFHDENNVLRVVPASDLSILDPIWTTATISQDHGYMIYDTLFGMNAEGRIQPQMVDSYETSQDGKTWTFKLRDRLEFHDGQPVTSEDVAGVAATLEPARHDGAKARVVRREMGTARSSNVSSAAEYAVRAGAGVARQAERQCPVHHAKARGSHIGRQTD